MIILNGILLFLLFAVLSLATIFILCACIQASLKAIFNSLGILRLFGKYRHKAHLYDEIMNEKETVYHEES